MEGSVSRLPSYQGDGVIFVTPTMEAGMKEEIRKSHGHWKTKEVFSFDDGLAEQQEPFLTVARTILATLMNLDSLPNDQGEGGPDPEVVREMLQDALVLLGNANARLNVWPWSGSHSFRNSVSFKRGQQSGAERKRKWAYQPGGASVTFKYSKNSGGARRTSNSNQSANNTNSSWLSVICSPLLTYRGCWMWKQTQPLGFSTCAQSGCFGRMSFRA